MAYKDLWEFVQRLEEEGELVRISEELDPKMEAAALITELGKIKGPAVLMEKVRGYDTPVAGNLMGSMRRLALALEATEEKFLEEYDKRIGSGIPWVEVKEAPVKEIIYKGDEVDIFREVPALTFHEGDASPYITSGVAFIKDPITGKKSMGIHRIQMKGKNKLGIYISEASPNLKKLIKEVEKREQELEVAVALGVEPAMVIASFSTSGAVADKLQLAGSLRGEPLEMVQGETVDFEVPANAMFILEGKIPPGIRELDGPFGESTGCYISVQSPIIQVNALTRRKKPIISFFQTFSEDDALFSDVLMSHQTRKFLRLMFPYITDVACSIQHNVIAISIKKENEWDARGLLHYICALFALSKLAIIVDDDINVHNFNEVAWAVAARFQPDKDIVQISKVMSNPLDASLDGGVIGSKLGIDATKPLDRAGLYKMVDLAEEPKKKAQELLKKIGLSRMEECQ